MAFNFSESDEPVEPPDQNGGIKNVRKVDAVYPEEAKRKGVQGESWLKSRAALNGCMECGDSSPLLA